MANVLTLHNNYSWLNSNDERLKDLLWRGLRFRRRNYFHSAAYKQKLWSGYDEFFKKESGRFLTGLLPEVKLALETLKLDYNVIDHRSMLSIDSSLVDKYYLNQWIDKDKNPIDLYDYQVDYINQACLLHRGIVRAPTGGGKTNCLIGILKKLPPGTPTLVMTKSKDLCFQIYDDIAAWNFPNLGKCIGGSKKDFSPGLITVANIDSVHKIEKLLPHFRAVLVDEVHLMMSKVPKNVYKKMNKASFRIAFSATPFKFAETDKSQKYEVKGFFGPVLKFQNRVLTTKELQEREILSTSKCMFYPIEEPELPYETYQDAVTFGIAECISFNQTVAKLASKLKGRTLIIVERVAQGELLKGLIPGSHWIYGKDGPERRKEVIGHLQNSDRCVCIVQQGLISAGLNFYIHSLINAMGGVSEHNLIQRLGRGLRKSSDKDDFTYYDFVFYGNRYLLDHSHRRIKTFQDEGHEIILKEDLDF